MDRIGATVCKAFLQIAPANIRQRLFSLLPQEEQDALNELPDLFYGNPSEGLTTDQERLNQVHYTWLTPLFRSFSENEIRLFLASLREPQVKGLKKALLFSNSLPELNPMAFPFFHQTLMKMLQGENELLPIECLPDSPLNALLDFDLLSLLTLIDLLGLHDLALEVKQIIETAKLKKISQALTQKEQSYLKRLLHQKERVSFKRLSLQRWDGDAPTLRSLLHKRGLNRLAKALFGKAPDLLWHISHKLDIERGQMLLELAEPLEPAQASDILAIQVEEAITKMQSEKAA